MTQEQAITPYEQQFNSVRKVLFGLRERFTAALADSLSPDKLCSVALTTWRSSDKLFDCDPMSFAGAIMECAQLNLMPDPALGHVYLLPFLNRRKNIKEVQIILGYKGLVVLAKRSGQVHDVQAQVVYEKDDFDFEYGTNEFLRHKWDATQEDRGKAICVYMFAKLPSSAGSQHFQVLPWSYIERTRERAMKKNRMWIERKNGQEVAMASGKNGNYQTDTPWVTDYHEMARKTAVRFGAKLLPLSTEFQRAAALDESAEIGIEQNLREALETALPLSERPPELGPGDRKATNATASRVAAIKEKAKVKKIEQQAAEENKAQPSQEKRGAEPFIDPPSQLTEEELGELERANQKAKEGGRRAGGRARQEVADDDVPPPPTPEEEEEAQAFARQGQGGNGFFNFDD